MVVTNLDGSRADLRKDGSSLGTETERKVAVLGGKLLKYKANYHAIREQPGLTTERFATTHDPTVDNLPGNLST